LSGESWTPAGEIPWLPTRRGEADVKDIFTDPRMPYTLVNSIPRVDRAADHQAQLNPRDMPSGCPFHPRRRFMQERHCTSTPPALIDTGAGHMVRCVRWDELELKAEIVPR
jgi:oligopeptide/dipeptide ABC transporter ATP-binding protein